MPKAKAVQEFHALALAIQVACLRKLSLGFLRVYLASLCFSDCLVWVLGRVGLLGARI